MRTIKKAIALARKSHQPTTVAADASGPVRRSPYNRFADVTTTPPPYYRSGTPAVRRLRAHMSTCGEKCGPASAWMIFVLVIVMLTLGACAEKEEQQEKNQVDKEKVGSVEDTYVETGDLESIKSRGKIRFLLPRVGVDDSFLPREGFPLYHEIDLTKAFAEHIGLEPQWIFVDQFSDMLPLVLEGKGDVIAANLTVTEERKKQINFTVPITIIREQLIVRSDDTIARVEDLKGRRVAIQKSSSFWETATKLKAKVPDMVLQAVPEDMTLEEVLDGVATRKFDITISDSNVVSVVLSYQDKLKVAFDVTGDRAIAWGLRPDAQDLKLQLDKFLTNEKLTSVTHSIYKDDLPEIKKRKVLRVLTRNNAATYFLWRGELLGFDYELVREFAKRQGLRLQIVVPPSRGDLLPWLIKGKGDLIAASMTINPELETGAIKFSKRVNTVSEIVVTRAGDNTIETVDDLEGRTFYVRPSSSYWQTLLKLKDNGVNFEMKAVPETMETEEIIAKVAGNEYDLTLSDSHILDIELTWRDDITGALNLGDPVDHGWVVRAADQELLNAINSFVKKEYRGLFYNVTHQKYFQKPHTIRKRLKQRVDRGNGKLSPYDDIVQEVAEEYHFDWRLIVAQMYQESRFNPKAKSWAGAKGLMQVMPRTANELGIKNLKDPAQGIEAGVKYLSWLRERFEPELSVQDRMWFALASYNAGVGHVRDARRLAKQKGWEVNRWFDNVERAMLLLSKRKYAKNARHGWVRGKEPVKYVRDIRDRYQAYVKLTNKQ